MIASLLAAAGDANGGVALFAILVGAFMLVAAIKTAMNGRWGLFVLGFFCGIAWIVGWASGPYRRY